MNPETKCKNRFLLVTIKKLIYTTFVQPQPIMKTKGKNVAITERSQLYHMIISTYPHVLCEHQEQTSPQNGDTQMVQIMPSLEEANINLK
jgi:hypothetical protein